MASKKSAPVLRIERDTEEDARVYLGEESIADFSYDRHGWGFTDALEAVRKVAEKLGAVVVEEWGEEEDDEGEDKEG